MTYAYHYEGDLPAWAAILICVVVAAIAVGLSCVVASKARKKGYSYGGFWCLSFFLSFIVGFIVVLCIPDRTEQTYYGQQPPPGRPPYTQGNPQQSYQAASPRVCPQCGRSNDPDAEFCAGCGVKL